MTGGNYLEKRVSALDRLHMKLKDKTLHPEEVEVIQALIKRVEGMDEEGNFPPLPTGKLPVRKSDLTLYYVDDEAGSGKTYEALRYAMRTAASGKKVIIAKPSLELIGQSIKQMEDIRREVGASAAAVAVVRITTEDIKKDKKKSSVQREISSHVAAQTETRDGSILFITHRALLLIRWLGTSAYELIIDEAFEVTVSKTLRLLDCHREMTRRIVPSIERGTAFYRLLPRIWDEDAEDNEDEDRDPKDNTWLLERTSHYAPADEVHDIFRDLCEWVMRGDRYVLHVAMDAWDRVVYGVGKSRGPRGLGRVIVHGFIEPTFLTQFRKVTVLGALLPETMMWRLWSARGVNFVRSPDIKPKQTTHQIGKRKLTIYYLTEDIWSKSLREKAGGIKHVLPLLKPVVGDERFAVVANLDVPFSVILDQYPAAVQIPTVSHGLNRFMAYHTVVFLPALNGSPPEIAYLGEMLHIDAEAQHTARSVMTGYQGFLRCSIRDAKSTHDVKLVVADRKTAEWIAPHFSPKSQVNVVSIDSTGVIPRKKGATERGGRPSLLGRPMTPAERTRLSRQRKTAKSDNSGIPNRDALNSERDNTGTPPTLAKRIVDYLIDEYGPFASHLDPARGSGAFFDALPEPKDWCEIQRGRDFLDYTRRVSLIVTNPPWTPTKLRPFMRKCFETADHVALLAPIRNLIGTRARNAMAEEMGFRRRLLIDVPRYRSARGGFTEGGIQISLVYWERGWSGDLRVINWRETATVEAHPVRQPPARARAR